MNDISIYNYDVMLDRILFIYITNSNYIKGNFQKK